MSSVTTFDVGFTTLNNVEALSDIAYDIRDMATALDKQPPDFLEARRIYEFGKNSPQFDRWGNEKDKKLSLQAMAGGENKGMFNEDPTYMFQVLGLSNAGQTIEDTISRHGQYADAYIMEQLTDYNTENPTLGAQASTILIVSMYATHQLWGGLMDCVSVYNGYDPAADPNGRVNPAQKFDNFIGLYVGAGQTLAPDWDGDMLYELAQAGADLFDTTDREGEAHVNSHIRQGYQSIQRLMSEPNNAACKKDNTMQRLWAISNRIIAQIYVPLTQMLIHSMKQADQAHKVRMYSLAVVPQLSQCRPSVHRKLKDYLIDKEYESKDFERILALLQESYDCLGFSCEDVGAYNEDQVAECAGYGKDHPMAAFIPKRDVHSLSKADLDIHAIDQLLKFPSTTNNRMAQLYYKYGKESQTGRELNEWHTTLSLQGMTIASDEEKWSPYYNDYVEYHKKEKFADAAIITSFESKDNSELRSASIVSLMRYSVVPDYMMGMIGLALENCPNKDLLEPSVRYWDSFAALYIGSLEGIDRAGSEDDGLMMWGLANNRARQFNTQNEDFLATVNEEMVDLLYAGQAQLERGDCTNFQKTASRVLHLMLIPLIQSTIWYAIRNEGLGSSSTDAGRAIGEVAAFSVLPIVAKYDDNAASVIERNMIIVSSVDPVLEGPQKVANAFFEILDDIGWGCEYVGQAEGIDTCEQFRAQRSGSMLSKSGAVAIVVGCVSIAWGVAL